MSLTPEAIDLLRGVQRIAREQPDKVRMEWWFREHGGGAYYTDDNGCVVIDGARDYVPRDRPLAAALQECGTTACIAGHIVALAGERVQPGRSISLEANRLIGYHPKTMVSCPLFLEKDWPEDLRERFESFGPQAPVVVDAIERWIEADGDPARFV